MSDPQKGVSDVAQQEEGAAISTAPVPSQAELRKPGSSGVIEWKPERAFVPLDPFMQMIAESARAPTADIAKLNALYDLMKRRDDDRAKAELDEALARAQATFPIIPERGHLRIYSKALREQAAKEGEHVYKGQRPQQDTLYALWEDVIEGISPSLTREGISLTFATQTVPAGEAFKIIVKGFLKRAGAVVEAETPPLQHDSTGSKNSIQAIKSTISYGKTMVAGMLVNFAARGENDEGQGGAEIERPNTISAEDVTYLRDGLTATGSNEKPFLEFMQAESLESMNETQFQIAKAWLLRKVKAAEKPSKDSL